MTCFRNGLAALLLMGLAAPASWADTVFLKNGDEIEGEIIHESAVAVVIKEKATGRLRSLRHSKIDLVIHSRNLQVAVPMLGGAKLVHLEKSKAPAAQPKKEVTNPPGKGPKAAGETGTKKGEAGKGKEKTGEQVKPGKGEEGEEGEGKKSTWPKLSDEMQAVVNEAMKKLGSGEPAERAEGAALLAQQGKDAIPPLIKGLQHKHPEGRAACARLLGELHARNAVKFLIEGLYAAMPAKGRAAFYQTTYVRALRDALKATTGQAFINVEAKSVLVQDGLNKYIEWYNENYDRLPPQVGEAEIDPTDPEYVEKLKKARALKLAKRAWPRPASSAPKPKRTIPLGGPVKSKNSKIRKPTGKLTGKR